MEKNNHIFQNLKKKSCEGGGTVLFCSALCILRLPFNIWLNTRQTAFSHLLLSSVCAAITHHVACGKFHCTE